MKQEIKSVLKKTAKIAVVTCLAAGSIAVLTSGVALKAIGEGGKYLANTVKKIIDENDRIIESEAVTEDAAPAQQNPPSESTESI